MSAGIPGVTSSGGRADAFVCLSSLKLTAVLETTSHLFLSAHVSQGPSQDSPQFRPVVREAVRRCGLDTLLGTVDTTPNTTTPTAGPACPSVGQPEERELPLGLDPQLHATRGGMRVY